MHGSKVEGFANVAFMAEGTHSKQFNSKLASGRSIELH
jgi:hypothetical protein